MLFAVERLSERSEDWPTNNSFLDIELNNRADCLPAHVAGKVQTFAGGSFSATAKSITTSTPLSCNN